MWQYYNALINRMNGFTPREWLIGLGVVVVVGLICMKGFGSRSAY